MDEFVAEVLTALDGGADGPERVRYFRMDARICGIDPGLRVTGYAVLSHRAERLGVIDAGVFRIGDRAPLAERLHDLERDLTAMLNEHDPTVIAVEQLYVHYKHPRTAILMGHARGVILCTAAKRGTEVRSYSATRVKRFATGNGRASKEQVQQAMRVTLGLDSTPEPNDVADALAIALCCSGELERPALSGPSARKVV